EIEPHDLQAAFEVVRLDGVLEYAAQGFARDAAGGDALVPNDGPRAAAEAFHLCVQRRDLSDALHDGEIAVGTLHFDSATTPLVERRDPRCTADTADDAASFGHRLIDVDPDILGRWGL